MTGKHIRLNRLIEARTRTCLIVAIDHGMTSPRFLPGLFDTGARVQQAIAGGANVLKHGRGMANAHVQQSRRDTSLALMLTASAAGRPSGASNTPIGLVEQALRSGADAVVVYVALAGENEPEPITLVSRVGETCEFKDMPLIAEAEYANAYQGLDSMSETLGPEYLKRNARLFAELGVEITNVNWSGSAASFEEIIRACGKPVVLAGGNRISDLELLSRRAQARGAGAVGCSVGRNVFEHSSPQAMTAAIGRIFRDGWSAHQAHQELQSALQGKG